MGESLEVGAQEKVTLMSSGDHNALGSLESVHLVGLGFELLFITERSEPDDTFGIFPGFQLGGSDRNFLARRHGGVVFVKHQAGGANLGFAEGVGRDFWCGFLHSDSFRHRGSVDGLKIHIRLIG